MKILFRVWRKICLAGAVVVCVTNASAESRVALVIGNGGYKSLDQLPNPPNDASDVAEALKALGFKVTLGVDADQTRMQRLISEFGKSVATSDVSLFYYGGHGLQVSGRNFLVPVDAQFKAVSDIEKRTIHFDEVLDAQGKGAGIHLVFLDACRNNPIKNADLSLPAGGLARVGNARDFLIAFATQPDNVAFDGAGRNSPFAKSLLSHVATPGLDISNMMIAVRGDVINSTGGEQVPWDNSSLTRQFYFAGDASREASPEKLLWQLAGAQTDPALLAIYLDRYPKGAHVNDVRALLAEKGGAGPATRPDAGVEDELWRLALSGRERRLVRLYVDRYPGGQHTEDAAKLLASLESAEAGANDPAIVCERHATVPADATASAPGVNLATLKIHAAEAIEACQQAVAAHPENAHYVALLARATYAAEHYPESVALYRKAVDAGDARAMVSLGFLTENGDHVAKDIKAAYALYEKAAERHNADGAINFGFALVEGKVVEKNVPRALSLFQQASDWGSARATYNLATLISNGVGGKPAEALNRFKQAASLGYPEGYRGAAVLMDEGRGVPKDPGGAAEQMLRCVGADAGDCLAELVGKAQTWTPDTVKAIQAKLKAAGYYSGSIDGKSGPSLAPALKKWRLLGAPERMG